MEVKGSKRFSFSRQKTFDLLTNPDVIVHAMPGIQSLTPKSKHVFDAEIVIGVAGIKGSYQGTVEFRDVVPPERYTLCVKGDGPMGFMASEVDVHLAQVGTSSTEVTYRGRATVGGTVAGVGNRVLFGVGKLLVGQFFNNVTKQAKV